MAIGWLAVRGVFLNWQGNRQIYSTVLTQIKAAADAGGLGLSDVQAGMVASVFTACYGLCVPLAGFLGDRLRRKWQLLFSVDIQHRHLADRP